VTFTLGFMAGTNKERNGGRQVWFTPAETEARMQTYCAIHIDEPMASSAIAIVDGVR
jgi:hypothetical protein